MIVHIVPSVRSLVLIGIAPVMLAAQDSVVVRAQRQARDTLEAVTVRATRAGAIAPTSQTLLDRAAIERISVGQDAPLALLGTTGVTASSDAGAFSAYSSLRLRGIDQTRLAISVDGIPLNDPEDQVLYFSNIPDFMNSMQSVRIQRGVGSSAFGTASYAGSLDFESIPLATTERFSEAQMTGGSWGTGRVSLEGATGLQQGWAAYARASTQRTDGYRDHSGNRARSAFASAGWFGARDAVKFTGFAGSSRTQLAYYAPSEADLALNHRSNPMSPLERDDFHQEMASVQYTRSIGVAATFTATAYRNSAGGNYDVLVGPDLWNFNLDHVWNGLLSTFSWSGRRMAVATGAHISAYHRDHFLSIRPDLATRVYDNTGFKQEQSAFAKLTWHMGDLALHGDLQLRRAAFRYEPTAGTGIGEPSIDWLFVNPKVGVTWQLRPSTTVHASLGRNGREPSRTDLFAGADDLDATTAVEVLPLDQVRPERVTDLETGVRFARGPVALGANIFVMRFHDEIAAIGAISITGSPLRRNVDRSTRSGIELEATWLATTTLTLSGNAMWMRARIAEFHDAAASVTYRDVPPLLSPALVANAQGLWRIHRDVELSLGLRHVASSFLANDGNDALTTPAFTLADAGGSLTRGRVSVRIQAQNLFSATAYASGYTDGVSRFLFPVARRTLLATVSVTL